MNVLALCGSIRPDSSNHALLRAVQKLLPASIQWTDFTIKDLPYFDPGLQFGDQIPPTVKNFRALAAKADFLVISTPEYAHGIPGILKNALEWLVCEETMQKKVVVLIGTPSGGEYVKEYLLETLRTMDLNANTDATLVVRNARNQIEATGEIRSVKLHSEIENFVRKVF